MIRGDATDQVLRIKHKKTKEYIDCSIYSEIEVQYNRQSKYKSIKKLLSKNEVFWENGKLIIHLSQEDTFNFDEGTNEIQVRLYLNNKCKATIHSHFKVGKVLSEDTLK